MCDVSYDIHAEYVFSRIANIPKPGYEPFSKTLEAYISGIKKYFSFIFSPIYSESVPTFKKMLKFRNLGNAKSRLEKGNFKLQVLYTQILSACDGCAPIINHSMKLKVSSHKQAHIKDL